MSVKDSEKEGEKEEEKRDDNTSQVGCYDLIHVFCKYLPRSKFIKYSPWLLDVFKIKQNTFLQESASTEKGSQDDKENTE